MNKVQFVFLKLLLLSVGAIATCYPAIAADQKNAGYYIEEKLLFQGIYKITVCPNAVRVDSPNAGFTLISKAPQWTVVIYRLDKRQYATLAYANWRKVNSLALNNDMFGNHKQISQSTGEENGEKILYYFFSRIKYGGTFGIYQSEDKRQKPIMQRSRVTCLDWPDDIHPAAILGKLYGLPILKGVPIAIESGPIGGKTFNDIEMKTIKLERLKTISAHTFDVPPGFRVVDFTDALFVRNGSLNAIKDLLGSPNGD